MRIRRKPSLAEAREETGLKVKPARIVGVFGAAVSGTNIRTETRSNTRWCYSSAQETLRPGVSTPKKRKACNIFPLRHRLLWVSLIQLQFFWHPMLQHTSSGLPDEAVVMLSWRNRSKAGAIRGICDLSLPGLLRCPAGSRAPRKLSADNSDLARAAIPGSRTRLLQLRPSYRPARRYAPLYLCRSAKPL